MSSTATLIAALKQELKSAGVTYAELAQRLGMAESSVKRMLAKGEMPLSRLDAICAALAAPEHHLVRGRRNQVAPCFKVGQDGRPGDEPVHPVIAGAGARDRRVVGRTRVHSDGRKPQCLWRASRC